MGWISWVHIAPYLVSFGPFGLTIIGAWMALTPPRQGGWGRFVLLALVLVVGLPTSWATLQANLSADRTSADTNQRVRGLSDALSTFAQQTETLTPHTFAVEAGTSFHVPSVMAEVVVRPKPDIKKSQSKSVSAILERADLLTCMAMDSALMDGRFFPWLSRVNLARSSLMAPIGVALNSSS